MSASAARAVGPDRHRTAPVPSSAPSSAASAAPGAAPSPRRAGAPSTAPAPRLRLVRAPLQARTRVPFVLLCMAVLGAALLTALLLNTTMAGGAYAKYELSSTLGQLEQDRKDLQAELDERSAPGSLARAATALGMVPADGTGWIRLSDGTVQGRPGAAG